MNSFHLRHNERAQRVTSNIDSQSEDFPEGSKGFKLNAEIKQDMTRLAELDVVRSNSMTGYEQATAARQNAHRLLTDLLRRTINTAEAFAAEHPDTVGMFGRPQINASDQTLIADARSIADKAATLVGLFTENGMPATFVSDMRAYADTLENAMKLQTDREEDRKHANADMKEIIRHLSDRVERLDIIIRNMYTNEPAKLATWEMARHLEQPSHSKHDDDEEGNDTPPAPQP